MDTTATTRPQWTMQKVKDHTKKGKDDKCYMVFYEGKQCESAGAVYRIEQKWYHGFEQGKNLLVSKCGTYVEYFGEWSKLPNMVTNVLFAKNITDKAIYVADIECDHEHNAVEAFDDATTTTTTTTEKSATKANEKAATTRASTKAVSAACKDRSNSCSNWAVQGLCTEEAQEVYMTQNCPTACGVSGCGGQSTRPSVHRSHHLFLVCRCIQNTDGRLGSVPALYTHSPLHFTYNT